MQIQLTHTHKHAESRMYSEAEAAATLRRRTVGSQLVAICVCSLICFALLKRSRLRKE